MASGVCEFAEQEILLSFHLAPAGRSLVVKAEQMKHAMNDVANQFALRVHAEAARVGNRVVDADKNSPCNEGSVSSV